MAPIRNCCSFAGPMPRESCDEAARPDHPRDLPDLRSARFDGGLAIAIVLLLLWGLITRPAETLSVILLLAFLSALQSHPWITIGAMVALCGALLIARVKAPPVEIASPPIVLPPPDDIVS